MVKDLDDLDVDYANNGSARCLSLVVGNLSIQFHARDDIYEIDLAEKLRELADDVEAFDDDA